MNIEPQEQDNLIQLIHQVQDTIHKNTQQLANNDQVIINFIRAQINLLYRQVESLFSIYSIINFRYPLPPMRGWPISPDFGQIIITHILKEKPKTIFECGGGISTILCGYMLEKIGEGKIISLDHEEKFLSKTKEELRLHQIKVKIDGIYSPLKNYEINGKTWLWYDLEKIRDEPLIDMLIVDGPPSTVQQNARYPALPLLRKYFSDKITIFIDDAGRKEEREMINLWMEEFPEFAFESIETEKGVAILKKK